MNRVLAALLVLGWTASAEAAPPAVITSGSFDSIRRIQPVRITFGPGDSGESSAIPNFCASWSANFDASDVASAGIYSVNTPGQSAAAGTLLKTFTSDDTTTKQISVSAPFLKVLVITPPASGTAQVFAYCTQTALHMRPWPVTDTPPPCIAASAGTSYYDISLRTVCICIDDGTPAWETIDRAILDTPTSLSCG